MLLQPQVAAMLGMAAVGLLSYLIFAFQQHNIGRWRHSHEFRLHGSGNCCSDASYGRIPGTDSEAA
eukprot:1215357-Amphidinium_carterae.1